MVTVTQLSKSMQEVLQEKANKLAVTTGFIQREGELTGSSFITGLMSGWQADPQASLSGLSQAIGNAGTPITRQALEQRFDANAVQFAYEMLQVGLGVMVKATPPATNNILNRFTSVELADSSIVTLPNELGEIWQGCGGFGDNARISSLKLNVRLDVKSGQIKVLELTDGNQHDRHSLAHQVPVEKGGMRIEDLAYFKLDDLETVEEQEAYYLTRYKQKTIVCDEQGEPIDLVTWLPQQVGDSLDCVVRVGKTKQLSCRLVAERVPQEVVEQRHERLREDARQAQREVSEHALVMAQWTIYLTNTPHSLLSTQEIFLLGQYRWQIELLFKLWKSDLQVDKWRTQNPYRILCEIYIKLLGAIITHWLLLVACWHNPRRSLRQAMPTIRGLAWQFANSLSRLSLLKHAFKSLCRSLSCCSMDKSRHHPRAFQYIYDEIP